MKRQVHGFGWLAAGAAAALLLGGAYAATAPGGIPGSDGVFNACYDNGGNVKLVPAGTSCSKGWTPTSWSQTGPAGPAGAAGQDGADGATGAPGADGANGTDGAPGADGDSAYEVWLAAGNQGTEADFLASLKGEPGQAGLAGPQGPKGDTGATGPQGPAGPGIASIDSLAGLTCSGPYGSGTTVLTYGASGEVRLTCSPDGTTTDPLSMITKIKTGFTNDGRPVTVKGVVTATTSGGLYVQNPYVEQFAGIFVRGSSALPPAVGTTVDVTGTVEQTERIGSSPGTYYILNATSVSVSDLQLPMPPAVVGPYWSPGPVGADPYVGMLVTLQGLTVNDLYPAGLESSAWQAQGPPGMFGEYQFINVFRDPAVPAGLAIGTTFESVTGVLGFRGVSPVLTLTTRAPQDFVGQVNP